MWKQSWLAILSEPLHAVEDTTWFAGQVQASERWGENCQNVFFKILETVASHSVHLIVVPMALFKHRGEVTEVEE
ncbi:hypothetical protein CGMCC3_g328 [Colletotrichum fructicola]|nr:uncharacterized protein CGMCC3_g328 [Colletotrichum fructicola]KAE9583589.1 hypothetical protein CGMCC3_g328 [Colletotrichum fructicola]